MKKVIYPYVRFSSDKQAKGSSLKRQTDSILKYAEEHGYTVNNSLKLEDLGLSAYTAEHVEKGALGVFLDGIEAELIEDDGSAYLCIEQLDRLSRQDVDEAYQLFRKILKANVNIITLMDGKIYTKDSLNDLMSITYSLMLMAQSNMESKKKSERVLSAFDNKIEKLNNGINVQFSGMFPGWIDNVGTKYDTKFVVNDKAKIIKRVFKRYLNGTSMGEIARQLNDDGVEQVAKSRHKNFTNSWSSAKISHILNNRCVIGQLGIKKTGEVYDNYYPSIISIDDWDVVQSMRTTRKITKSSGRNSINIFKGKMFCSGCGQKYYFEQDDKMTKTGRKVYHMLKCQGRRVLKCNSKSIKYDDFIQSNPTLFGVVTKGEKKSKRKEITAIKNIISEVSEDTKKIKTKITHLEKLDEDNELDYTTYLKESSKLEKQLKVNERRVAGFKVDISRLSNDNKLKEFDKNNPSSIIKARRYVDENYAAFIISSNSKHCTSLLHDGGVTNFKIKNTKMEKRDKSLGNTFEAFEEFYDFQEEIVSAYRSGRMDGKFIEILRASNQWGIETPETDFSFE